MRKLMELYLLVTLNFVNTPIKSIKMKKLLFLSIIAALLTSCSPLTMESLRNDFGIRNQMNMLTLEYQNYQQLCSCDSLIAEYHWRYRTDEIAPSVFFNIDSSYAAGNSFIYEIYKPSNRDIYIGRGYVRRYDNCTFEGFMVFLNDLYNN